MTQQQAIVKGTRVRFTIGPLGAMGAPDDRRFGVETVNEGDIGHYVGPFTGPDMADWYLIAVNLGGRDMFVPCHESQFDVVA